MSFFFLQSGEQKREKKEKTADTISDPVLLEQYVVITDFKSKQRNQVGGRRVSIFSFFKNEIDISEFFFEVFLHVRFVCLREYTLFLKNSLLRNMVLKMQLRNI